MHGVAVMLWGVSVTIHSTRKYTLGLDSAARLPGTKVQLGSLLNSCVTQDLLLSLSVLLFSHL